MEVAAGHRKIVRAREIKAGKLTITEAGEIPSLLFPAQLFLHIINEEVFPGLVSKRNSAMYLKNNYAFEVSHIRFIS